MKMVGKGNGRKSKGESKRSGANSPMTTSPRWKEIKRNSWGFCSRSTDMPRTKPSRNTRISSAATRGSNVLPLTITWNQGGYYVPDLWMQSVQDLRQGDQERGMRRLQQAIRKVHLQEEIGEFQAERDHKGTTRYPFI